METLVGKDSVVVYLPDITVTINAKGPTLVTVNRDQPGPTELIKR